MKNRLLTCCIAGIYCPRASVDIDPWKPVDKALIAHAHADWGGFNQAIDATGAEEVMATHGYSDIMPCYLSEKGIDATVLTTAYEGETWGDGD